MSAQSTLFAIKAGILIDPEAGTASSDEIVITEGAKIKDVGAGVRIPSGATVIDLSKSAVLPGLFDAHTHLCSTISDPNPTTYSLLNTTAYRALQGAANARSMLEAGFTTVRDVGNAGNYGDTALRQAIEGGLIPGSTIINAGRSIGPYGGQYQLQPERKDLGEPEYLYADTKDELRKAIRENIHFGAKVIKLIIDDQRYIYAEEEIRFAVEEAARHGYRVCAHCVTDVGAHNALPLA